MPQKLRWDRVACRKCGHGIPILFRKCPSCKYVYFGDELTELKSSKKGLIRLIYWIYGVFVACLIIVSLISAFDDGSGSEEEKLEAAKSLTSAIISQTSVCDQAERALSKVVEYNLTDLSSGIDRHELSKAAENLWRTCLNTGSNIGKVPVPPIFGKDLEAKFISARDNCSEAYAQQRAVAYWMKRFLDEESSPNSIVTGYYDLEKVNLESAYHPPHDRAKNLVRNCYRDLNKASMEAGVDLRRSWKDLNIPK